jgi:hypothetical protein
MSRNSAVVRAPGGGAGEGDLNDEEIEIYGPEDGDKNLFGYQDAVDYTHGRQR